MISFFNNYLTQVVSVVIFIAFAEILSVKNKNGKLVKTIFSLVVTISLISPISALLSGKYSSKSVDADVEFTNYLVKYEKKSIEKEVSSLLKVSGLNVNDVIANVNYIEGKISTKKVLITLNCDGINCSDEHINITTKTKTAVTNSFFSNNNEVEIVVEFIESNSE